MIASTATSTSSLPNSGHGIAIDGSDDNDIGYRAPLPPGAVNPQALDPDIVNVILGNQFSGVSVGRGGTGNSMLGNSITRAWPGVRSEGAASGGAETGDVRLQFREDSENPKVISLSYAAGSVRVATESAHAD